MKITRNDIYPNVAEMLGCKGYESEHDPEYQGKKNVLISEASFGFVCYCIMVILLEYIDDNYKLKGEEFETPPTELRNIAEMHSDLFPENMIGTGYPNKHIFY